MTNTPMNMPIRASAAAALFTLASIVPAAGQTRAGADRPLFVDISAGLGGKPSALTAVTTFTIFGEDGTAATQVAPGVSGLADLRVGYHVTPRVGVAAAFSASQSNVSAAATASVPSPVRFSSPTIVPLTVPDARRRELGVHLQAVFARPLTDSMTITVAGGPSIVHLQQGLPTVAISGTTPTVVSVNESGTGFGGNVGADLSTFFSDRYGLGVFVRYVAATVDLPSAAGAKAGGVQAGVGVRLRF